MALTSGFRFSVRTSGNIVMVVDSQLTFSELGNGPHGNGPHPRKPAMTIEA